MVTIDDLIKMVNIALGLLPVDECPTADADDSEEVTVDELIRAVNAALSRAQQMVQEELQRLAVPGLTPPAGGG